MPEKSENSGERSQYVDMLDCLIAQYYELLKVEEDNVKLGGLLKMIELRHKIQPSDGDQKRFWKMLDSIRQERLTAGSKTGRNGTASPKKQSTTSSRSSKRSS